MTTENVLFLAQWIRGYAETPYPALGDWELRLHPVTRMEVLASPAARERWDLTPRGFSTLAGVRIVSDPAVPEGEAELRLSTRMQIPTAPEEPRP